MATMGFANLRPALAATALLLLGLAACSGTSNRGMIEAAAPQEYHLGPGDRVSVNVYGEQSIAGEYDVDETGTLSLPLAGRVNVRDMTSQQAENALQKKLSSSLENPQVNVSVVEYRSFYILGEVGKPGAYPYRAGATVLNAVALAGGYTYRASTNGISVMRPSATAGTQETKLAQQDSYLQPGDIVIVPARWF